MLTKCEGIETQKRARSSVKLIAKSSQASYNEGAKIESHQALARSRSNFSLAIMCSARNIHAMRAKPENGMASPDIEAMSNHRPSAFSKQTIIYPANIMALANHRAPRHRK